MTSIKEIMKKDFSKISSSDSVESAVELMEKRGVDYLLIEDEEEGGIKGVVTSHELVGYPSSRLVLDCKIKPIATISEETRLNEALKVLEEKEVNFLVILNKKGSPIGVINKEIILSFLYQEVKKSNKAKKKQITERKRAEEALRASESEKKSILNAISDVVVFQDKSLSIRWVNEAAARSVGKTPQELVGCHCYELWHGRSEPCEGCPVLRAQETGSSAGAIMRTPDEKWWEISAEPMRDIDEKIVGAMEIARDITERKRAEDALRTAEQDWRDSFNSLEDVMLVIDRDYNIENINEIGLKLLGKSKEEVIGKKCYQVISGADSPAEECPCKKSLETKEVESLDWYEERLGKYYSIKSSPIFDENGEVIQFVDLRRDITEQKRAEGELRKSEQKFRTLFENIPDIAFVVDEEGRYVEVNEKTKNLLQKPDIIGKRPEELGIPLTIAKMWRKDQEKCRITKQLNVNEFNLFGRSIQTILSLIPKTGNIIGVARDVTERKRAEDELRQKSEEQKVLLSTIPAFVYFKDSEDRYIAANRAFADMTGTPMNQIAGKNDYDLFPREEAEFYRKCDREVMKSGEPIYNIEETVTGADGKKMWVSTSKTPIFDSDGNVIGMVGITLDITKRKKMEDTLLAAYKELETLDKMKTDFLNVAYHEMLTPLTPIVGYASLLEQSELTEKQKNYVRIIGESTSQLNELIGSLLEVARLGAGKMELTVQEVSIPEIVKEVLERVKPQVDAKKQTISTVVPDGIEVEGDKQKITAIFEHLILNAIKFTGENGRIDIVVEDRKDKGDIRVCVADTGVGISEENLPRIFERFYMVDTSLTRKGGLGLGLALLKGYVKLHGGKVWATSELGKGSKFCFILPKKRRGNVK